MHLSRIIVVALAVAALVAPTAAAKPIDAPVPAADPVAVPDMRASVAEALAKQRRAEQTLPGPLGPPTWPMNPQPLDPPAATPAAPASDGVDWRTLAIGAGLALVAMAGMTLLVRARQRPRVA